MYVQDVLEAAELRLDPSTAQAFVAGASAGLTKTEFRLLYALASERGRILTREELLERVWAGAVVRERAVDHLVRKVRRKLEVRSSAHDFIHTWVGLGYQFEPEPRGRAG